MNRKARRKRARELTRGARQSGIRGSDLAALRRHVANEVLVKAPAEGREDRSRGPVSRTESGLLVAEKQLITP